jgi:UDP-glucose 4-epimerase
MGTDSVLITGSSGFIGTALAERLIDSGYSVTGIDVRSNAWSDRVDNRTERADLLTDDIGTAVGSNFDLVVHLAAHSRVGSTVETPAEAIENGQTTQAILDFTRKNDINKFVFASSREVYGSGGPVLCDESNVVPERCANPYAASKIFGESLCWSYMNCYDMNITSLRFTSVYGRYDRQSRVMPLFISQALSGKQLSVYGEQKLLDFVYLDDCVAATERAIERIDQVAGEAINVGSGVGTALTDLAEYLTTRIDSCPGFEVTTEQTGEPARMVADLGKARALLGFDPEYGIETGLNETIEWYRNHPELIDSLT